MRAAMRHPAVSGRFYPGEPETLRRDLHMLIPESTEKTHAVGCIVPHAGYMYSGHVAGAVYARLALPRRYIVLCPNHTGYGEPLSVISSGSWITPLGEAQVDSDLAAALKSALPLLREDTAAHEAEHAIEVQVPFLQKLAPEFSFVPIVIGTRRAEVLEALGAVMANVVSSSPEPVLIVASSDMNHYESDEVTRKKDHEALKQILTLHPRGLDEVVSRDNISMCGVGPAIAMITAARRLGATKAELVKYATSGDTSGDYNHCVGYAGVIIS